MRISSSGSGKQQPQQLLPRSSSPLTIAGSARRGTFLWMVMVVPLAFVAGVMFGRSSSQQGLLLQPPAASSVPRSTAIDPSSSAQHDDIPAVACTKTPVNYPASSAENGSGNSTSCCDDGWQTIQVFYGNSAHFQSSVASRRWFSQAGQDELVVGLLRGKRDGYFVDLASNDATVDSNTFALERDYRWNGLCVEPNPRYWHKLAHYRPRCNVVAAVVGGASHRGDEILFRYANRGGHGGIAGPGFDNAGWLWRSFAQVAFVVPLLEILDRNGAPHVIDYLSLDVEGAESFVLMNFPFEKYRVNIVTVERPKDDIRAYLKSQGYSYSKRIARFGEVVFVHESAVPELDMTVLEKY